MVSINALREHGRLPVLRTPLRHSLRQPDRPSAGGQDRFLAALVAEVVSVSGTFGDALVGAVVVREGRIRGLKP